MVLFNWRLTTEALFADRAQWPSKDIADLEVETPAEHKAWFQRMRGAVDKVEILYVLTVADDLLATHPYRAV